MRVSSIEIINILGIEHLKIQPGAVTILEGRNAAGKTSVLSAIRSLAAGGHDPDLIRQGAEQGQVIIELDDGVSITKTIRPEKTTTVVRHPKLGKVSKPQEWINQVIDGLSLDPVQFLTARPKDRISILLEALPLKVTAEDLKLLPVEYLADADLDRHALEVLGDLHRRMYDRRREINTQAKEKRATAKQMAETLPDEPERGDWNDEFEAARSELARLNVATQKAVQAVRDASAARKAEIDAALQKEIDQLRARAEADKRIADEKRDRELAALQDEYTPKRNRLNERLTEAKTMLEQQARVEKTRELIEKLGREAAALEGQAERLSADLRYIEGLKARLLENIPIKGLEIRDGDIFVDGIRFDRVNDAEKHRIAVEIGKLKAGELGILLLDRAEIFDSASWASFLAAARASGLQIVAARVSNEDLTVRAEGVPNVA
jgi:DNA repair ATPase RecN